MQPEDGGPALMCAENELRHFLFPPSLLSSFPQSLAFCNLNSPFLF